MQVHQQGCRLQVTEAGIVTAGIARIAFLSRLIEVSGTWYGGNATSVPTSVDSQTTSAARVLTRIDQVTQAQRRLYLAISQSFGLPYSVVNIVPSSCTGFA